MDVSLSNFPIVAAWEDRPTITWDTEFQSGPYFTYTYPTDYTMARDTFSEFDTTITYFMEYMFEKWFIAIPQFYGWEYVQKVGGTQ